MTLAEYYAQNRPEYDMYFIAFSGEDANLRGSEFYANHPLVQYVLEHEDADNTKMICEQLYDLARIQNAPLEGEAMTKFIARSNEIMLTLTK